MGGAEETARREEEEEGRKGLLGALWLFEEVVEREKKSMGA
jgi:hypothetical protein